MATQCLPPSTHTEKFQKHLSLSLERGRSPSENLTAVCLGGRRVGWNGLPYLSAMSSLFRARSGEEQHFTLLLPDYSSVVVTKVLRLLASGEVEVNNDSEREEMKKLLGDLGVSQVRVCCSQTKHLFS